MRNSWIYPWSCSFKFLGILFDSSFAIVGWKIWSLQWLRRRARADGTLMSLKFIQERRQMNAIHLSKLLYHLWFVCLYMETLGLLECLQMIGCIGHVCVHSSSFSVSRYQFSEALLAISMSKVCTTGKLVYGPIVSANLPPSDHLFARLKVKMLRFGDRMKFEITTNILRRMT